MTAKALKTPILSRIRFSKRGEMGSLKGRLVTQNQPLNQTYMMRKSIKIKLYPIKTST